MKKLALRSGADEEPISVTGGMEEGSGAVSMRIFWLNLCGLVDGTGKAKEDATGVGGRPF